MWFKVELERGLSVVAKKNNSSDCLFRLTRHTSNLPLLQLARKRAENIEMQIIIIIITTPLQQRIEEDRRQVEE